MNDERYAYWAGLLDAVCTSHRPKSYYPVVLEIRGDIKQEVVELLTTVGPMRYKPKGYGLSRPARWYLTLEDDFYRQVHRFRTAQSTEIFH